MIAVQSPRPTNPSFNRPIRRRHGAGVIRPAIFGLAAAGGIMSMAATAHAGDGTNSVAYWCGSDSFGVKYEPVADPFIVPDVAPDGMTLTKAVVKAGSGPDENFVVDNPTVGQALSYPGDSPANSHVILCWEPTPTTTAPPTTAPPTTQPPTTQPPTTEPPVTEPQVTEPPATEPPTTEPPATEPPVVEQAPPAPPTTLVASLGPVPQATPAPAQQLPSTGSSTGYFAAAATLLTLGGFTIRRLSRSDG